MLTRITVVGLLGAIYGFPVHGIEAAQTETNPQKKTDFKNQFTALMDKVDQLKVEMAITRSSAAAALHAAIVKEMAGINKLVKDLPDGWEPIADQPGLANVKYSQAERQAILELASEAMRWHPVEGNPGPDRKPPDTHFFFPVSILGNESSYAQDLILTSSDQGLGPAKTFFRNMFDLLSPIETFANNAVSDSISKAVKRNDAFVKNVFDHEFPWEGLINGYLVKGTLSTPPTWQLIIGHIQGGMAVPMRGKTTVTPSFVLEGLGYEKVNKDTYVRSWGASLIFIPAANSTDNNGLGCLFRFGGSAQALGVVVKKTDGGGHVGNLVYSINLGSIISHLQ